MNEGFDRIGTYVVVVYSMCVTYVFRKLYGFEYLCSVH